MINFYKMYHLLQDDRVKSNAELTPIADEDLGQYGSDPEAEEELMRTHSKVHGFGTWAGNTNNVQTAANPLGLSVMPLSFEVGVRDGG